MNFRCSPVPVINPSVDLIELVDTKLLLVEKGTVNAR